MGTSNLTSRVIANFVLDAYTDIPIKYVLYKMDMIYCKLKLSTAENSICLHQMLMENAIK